MNIDEYNKIKKLNYLQYCDYLQKKYGISNGPYFNENWSKNNKISKTNIGLVVHHKFEDHAIMLSSLQYAKNNPYKWQEADALVYCDYLEHLFLHVLICEYPSNEQNFDEAVGIGGVINYLVPELNDLYSGWQSKQQWRLNCHNLIKNDKDVYFEILKRFKNNCKLYPCYFENCLYSSYNSNNGLWNIKKNYKLFIEISKL